MPPGKMVVSWSVGQKDLRSKQRTKLDCQKNGGVTTFPSASVGSDVWARVNGQVPRPDAFGETDRSRHSMGNTSFEMTLKL